MRKWLFILLFLILPVLSYASMINEWWLWEEETGQVWKEGDPVKKCSECHKENAAEKNSLTFCKKAYPAGKAPGLKCAYHMNCIGCHKAMKKEGKKAPTSCTKCHPKKK